jgi:hypothetical protein
MHIFHSLEKGNMKLLKYIASFTAVAFLLGASAFARDNNSGSFDLSEPAHVGATLLQPGHYKAEWTGPNDALKVSIIKNGKTVATTEGTIKELPEKASATEVTVKTEHNSRKQVEEIDFSNHSGALMLPGM